MNFITTYKYLIACFLLCVMTCRVSAQEITGSDTMATITMHGTYYSDRFEGRRTSSGEVFSQQKYTAAHYSFPMGTLLLVTNPDNGRQVLVRVNDRCPKRNILDMSRRAAKQIGIASRKIQVTVLPERFYSFWENQEQIVDVLQEGKFWDYIALHHVLIARQSSSSEEETKPASKHSGPNAEPAAGKAEKNKTHTTSHSGQVETDAQLYDIELSRCKSRSTAKKKVEQMPIYYQDKVDYKTNINANEVIVKLTVSQKEGKAKSIVNELSGIFPDAKIIKAE